MTSLEHSARWIWSGFCAVISLIIFFSFWLIPIVGSLFSFWTPTPLLILYQRWGPEAGRLGLALGLIGASVLGWGLSSVTIGGLFFFYYAVIALILGEAKKVKKYRLSDLNTITLSAFIAAGVMGGFLIYGVNGNQDFGLAWEDLWQKEVETFLKSYQGIGIDEDQVLVVRCALTQAGYFFLNLFPGILLATSLLLAWANLFLARRIIAIKGENELDKQKFSLLKLPESLAWLVIIAGMIVWMGEGWIYWGGINILLVLGVAYFIQGLAIVSYWLEKKNIPRGLRWGVYILLGIEFFLTVLVALAGLFDIWLNFRRLENPLQPDHGA